MTDRMDGGRMFLEAAGHRVLPDRDYQADSILVTIYDENDAYWHARIFTPRELGTYLLMRAEYGPDEQFRVWDIDKHGTPHECEIQTSSTGYDEHDWATVTVRVVRCGTGEFVIGTSYRLDGRA